MKATDHVTYNFSNIVLSSHPRLLLDNDSEQQIDTLSSSDSNIAFIDKEIIQYSDWLISQPALQYKLTGIRLLDISRAALKRIFFLSYAYRKSSKKEYAERAIKEMIAVCTFPDWHPSHYLDVAEMAMGVAIGYDWLYNYITPKQKELIVQAIKEKAVLPSFDDKYNSYKRRNNNWNSVCNAGMLYLAIAFHEEILEYADSIINDCLITNPRAVDQYKPDGGYPEGYCYWDYGTSFQILIVDALERNYGTDFGLTDATGFLNSGKFIQFMTAPSSRCFNFSDSPPNTTINIPLYWFAQRTNDPSLLYTPSKALLRKNELQEICKSRLLPLIPIFASRLNFSHLTKPMCNFWHSDGSTPVFIYRSGWDNSSDSYLGVKGGSPSTPHAHMDAGSFVYEFNGIRWASDLGMPNYNFIESKGIKLWDTSQESDRWEIVRMRNDHHNTLTVDNDRHNVTGKAKVIHLFMTDNRKGCVVDLSSTLTKVRKVHREVSLDEHDHLFIIDSIATADKDIQLHWTLITSAEPHILNNNSIILRKNNKQMLLSIESKLRTDSYANPVIPMHEYDEPIKGFSRVGFSVNIPAQKNTIFKTRLYPID